MLKGNLVFFRCLNGLKQYQVADMLGIHRTTYSKYEEGSSVPGAEVLIGLSKLYKVSVDVLLGLKNKSAEIAEPGIDYSVLSAEEGMSLLSLSDDEKDILFLYRLISDKKNALTVLKKLSETERNEDEQG